MYRQSIDRPVFSEQKKLLYEETQIPRGHPCEHGMETPKRQDLILSSGLNTDSGVSAMIQTFA